MSTGFAGKHRQGEQERKVSRIMAKKKTAAGLAAGTKVRVKAGVPSPEFPEIPLSGWVGAIVEASGKPPELYYVLEWDQTTIDAMPAEYVQKCEAQQLYYRMASLPESAVESV